MDETTQPAAPETTPAVEPAAPAAETPASVEDLTALTDDQVQAVIDEAEQAAAALANADEDFTPEREQQFEAALARRETAVAELSARADRADRLNAARTRAASFAPARRPAPPVAPAAPVAPRVADIPKPAAPPVPPAAPQYGFRFTVPTDAHNLVPGRSQGGEFASLDEVGHAMERRLNQYGGMPKGGRSVSHSLAMIQRDYGPELTATMNDTDDAVVRNARSQQRLPGGNLMRSWRQSVADTGSLTAAAGWCAPSETLYDLCELESMDGLIDLPEIMATRGGVRWTQDPSYAALDAATTFTSLTEAQVIADTPKVCSEITCPTFTDTRLNIAATCVTGSFLQLRGYPELVARFVRGAMVTHAHKLNEAIIAALVTQAGAVTPIVAPAGDPIVSALLSAVELAAEDIRYRNRMSFSAVIEIVLPHFVLPLLRADYTRRNGGNPGLSDQMIADWFAVRNVRPQFVYDWQDGYSGGGATSPGGDGTPPYTLSHVPASGSVEFLAYPAGAVVLARQDVITLRNVYDAANLQQNLYTELFFEEGWAPIYPCPDLRLYSALACPSGATAVQIDLDCTV